MMKFHGSQNWMKSHEIRMASSAFGEMADDIKPIIPGGSSDSAALDAVFEALVRAQQMRCDTRIYSTRKSNYNCFHEANLININRENM